LTQVTLPPPGHFLTGSLGVLYHNQRKASPIRGAMQTATAVQVHPVTFSAPPQSWCAARGSLSPSDVAAAQRQLYTKASLVANSKQGLAAEDINQYASGLWQAAQLKRMAVTGPTQDTRDKQLREFETWLLRHTERDLQTCIPGDFEAYFAGTWMRAHGKAGQLPSNSSVDTLISNLRLEMKLLGRESAWREVENTGEELLVWV